MIDWATVLATLIITGDITEEEASAIATDRDFLNAPADVHPVFAARAIRAALQRVRDTPTNGGTTNE